MVGIICPPGLNRIKVVAKRGLGQILTAPYVLKEIEVDGRKNYVRSLEYYLGRI